ncbi:MAG: thiopeptide-type bacteriocin biosynthesis protein [Bacteroidales bacterium]|nr:thiopeptide-type bacteriocin biosynthesis protein [Bacteroidales bacterium]
MNNKEIQRNFIIGDAWNYFKVYTGFKTADAILTGSIDPLVNSLITNKIIDKWFFIRYSDPKFHLRIRFHVNDPNHAPAVMMNFNQAITQHVQNQLIWKVQADTYSRELERYGTDTMELSETLFWHDSEMIIKVIAFDKVKQDENLRWLLGLKMIDILLDDFGFSLSEKCNLLNTLQENFGKEFGINAESRRQFGSKYRNEKAKIEKILDKNSEQDEEYSSLFKPVFEKSEASKSIIKEIRNKITTTTTPPLNDLLSSYIHMTLNRLFRTQQRMHELVLYDYLFRYYNSLQARQKVMNN